MFLGTLQELSEEQAQLQSEHKSLQEAQQTLFSHYKLAYTEMRQHQGATREMAETEIQEFHQQLIFGAIEVATNTPLETLKEHKPTSLGLIQQHLQLGSQNTTGSTV
eukprot:TRINITY_DN9743_c0_g1_i1.p1 TRINITY_DN9743_c0_g1~~TRINITY_DN9743_c0_g1_i1.p1  ORF type:complete len:107 (-),score=15.18 TRINITY_DN9743_c0_g1_i1:44-364(-)